MEDEKGLHNFVEKILQTLKTEKKITSAKIGRVILSAHNGDYRPTAFADEKAARQKVFASRFCSMPFMGNMNNSFRGLNRIVKIICATFITEHLAGEHQDYITRLQKKKLKFTSQLSAKAQIVLLLPTTLCHNCVITNDSTLPVSLRSRKKIIRQITERSPLVCGSAASQKRSLALREFSLAIENLERFARKESLRRVHECVFGVLAMESEPVDSRL